MKRKSQAALDGIQRRLERERWQRRLAEKFSRYIRRIRKSDGRSIGRTRKPPTYNKAAVFEIDVPIILDLVAAHKETCEFIQLIREKVKNGHRVCLMFTAVSKIRGNALMYLLAQIHKLRIEYGDRCVTGTYPDSKRIERQLSQTGFFELLRVKSRAPASKESRATRYIKFKSAQRIFAERIGEVRAELLRDDLKMPPFVGRTIFRALGEAMTNVNHHAYFRKSFLNPKAAEGLRGRWWLFGSLDVKRNIFTLVFYDCGVGIPKTLPRKYSVELIREYLSLLPGFNPDDGQMISAAMALGRTRTELDNRGKGLLDLARLIDQVGAGQMQIFSRHGTYTYTGLGSAHKNGQGFVEGTLIEWRLPLDRAVEALSQDLQDEAQNDA